MLWHEPPGFVRVVGVVVKPPHNTTRHQTKQDKKNGWSGCVNSQGGPCAHRWPWAWWCVVLCGEAKVAAHQALVHKAKGGCVAWAVVGLGVLMVVGLVVWVWCALPTTTSVDGLVDGTMVAVVWCGTRHRTHWSSTQPHHVRAVVVVVWMWCLVIDDQPHLGHAQQSSHSWWHCVVVVLFELHQHHTTRGGGICVWCG